MEKIKELRNKTGAGMVDCKNALEESCGDIKKAIEILRKKGIAKAAKRDGQDAKEGIIKIAVNKSNNEGYIMEINTETDFAARSEKFQDFADKVMEIIKTEKPRNIEKLMNIKMDNGETIKDVLHNLSGVIGEKLNISRCAVLTGKGTIAGYTHAGGRIGVLVSLDKPGKEELARDIAMHIAAANPCYIAPEDTPKAEINKEKEIYTEQLKKEGKPKNIIDKILIGKINKYFTEICLIKQEYIKDDKKQVQDILGDIKVEKFLRYAL